MDKKVLCFSTKKKDAELLGYYLLNEGIDLSQQEDINSFDREREGLELILYDKECFPDSWADDIRSLCGSRELLLVLMAEEDDVMAKLSALSLGADLCLPGNTAVVELAAYIKAIIRRRSMKEKDPGLLRYGDASLSKSERTAWIKDRALNLTPNEFDFLKYMICADRAVSKEEMLKAVWGFEDSYLRTHVAEDLVKRLRKKLKEMGSDLSIEAIRGYGWRLSGKM